MPSGPLFFSPAERYLLDQVTEELGKLPRYTGESLAEYFTRIVAAFEQSGETQIVYTTKTLIAELQFNIHLDVRDPLGKDFPELHLQYRERSLSPVVRWLRHNLALLPRARVLVLTPLGYRISMLRNIENRRFLRNRRPRLAPYNASSVMKLKEYLVDTYGARLFSAIEKMAKPSA